MYSDKTCRKYIDTRWSTNVNSRNIRKTCVPTSRYTCFFLLERLNEIVNACLKNSMHCILWIPPLLLELFGIAETARETNLLIGMGDLGTTATLHIHNTMIFGSATWVRVIIWCYCIETVVTSNSPDLLSGCVCWMALWPNARCGTRPLEHRESRSESRKRSLTQQDLMLDFT